MLLLLAFLLLLPQEFCLLLHLRSVCLKSEATENYFISLEVKRHKDKRAGTSLSAFSASCSGDAELQRSTQSGWKSLVFVLTLHLCRVLGTAEPQRSAYPVVRSHPSRGNHLGTALGPPSCQDFFQPPCITKREIRISQVRPCED